LFCHIKKLIDDRKLLFPFEAVLEQKPKKIAISLFFSAKLKIESKEKLKPIIVLEKAGQIDIISDNSM